MYIFFYRQLYRRCKIFRDMTTGQRKVEKGRAKEKVEKEKEKTKIDVRNKTYFIIYFYSNMRARLYSI